MVNENLRSSHNWLLWANGLVTAIFGIAFLGFPSFSADIYALTLNDAGLGMMRILGGVILSLSILSVLATNVDVVAARRAIDTGMLAAWLLAGAAYVYNIYLTGFDTLNNASYVTLGVFALFVLAFGFYVVGRDFRAGISLGRPAIK